ncbi:MAG: FAD-dependent oxidoreductase [Planctomycetaceae bacterium]
MQRSIVASAAVAIGLVAAGPPIVDAAEPHPFVAARDAYATRLLVVGGSSAGTAAAITAGRLGMPTIWVVRAPRDIGGLSTNGINPDSDLPMRYLGGLALEYDVVARVTTGFGRHGRHNGEGYFAPFHVFWGETLRQVQALPSLSVLADLYPVAVEKDPATRRVRGVTFGDRRDPGRRIVIAADAVIDAEIEGDVAFLAGATTTLRREARVASEDPTRHQESYAGRIFTREKRIGSLLVAGGPEVDGTTHEADDAPATMGWNGSVTLEDFGTGTPESPWVLAREPAGYDPAEFAWWEQGVYGVPLDATHRRWNIDHYLSTVEGWRMPDGRHVLESFDIRDREANEKAHLAHVLRGLWHLQHVKREYRYGLSSRDFREGLPAKYTLADFGTTTNAGDAPLPGLIYMREGRRLVNDHVFGGRLIEDDGSGLFVQKRFWHPRAAYFNAMLVDIHGVHRERAAGSGPEGMQLLRLAGFHDFGAPCIPFDVFVPRPAEVTGLLVASAGAYTHQAYAAFPRMETGRLLQGHACAVAMHHALADGVPPHEVDVRKVQLTGLERHGQSLVYFDDALAGTRSHVVEQMLGCRGVPRRNDQGVFQDEAGLAVAEAEDCLAALFRDSTENPVPEATLAASLAVVRATPADGRVSRGRVVQALSLAAGIEPAASRSTADPPLFSDVPHGHPLAPLLAAWSARGWIAADAAERFVPDAAMPFAEFRRHAFNVLFGALATGGPIPVDYRPWIVRDAFNRPDGPVERLHSGQASILAEPWHVEGGLLRPVREKGTSYHVVDAGAADVDISADVFLEQTRNDAAAGIVLRGEGTASMERFLLQAKGPAVEVRIDRISAGERVDEVREIVPTLRRAFSLRAVARGDRIDYFLDGRLVRSLERGTRGGTVVGLVNGGDERSRFDNLEVRPPASRD